MPGSRSTPDAMLKCAVVAVATAACATSDDPGTTADRTIRCAPLSGYTIAFTSDRGTGYDIYRVAGDGERESRLTDWPGSEFGPRWSRDGGRIAFNADRDGDFDIWVMNGDGSGLRQITNLPGGEWDPDWAPDGQSLLFTYDDGSTRDVLSVNVDNGDIRNITQSEWDDYGPVFSPDGSSIAFLSNRHGRDGMNNEVYVMSATGSDVRRVTENAFRESILAWYPNGDRLAWTLHPRGDGPDQAAQGNDEIFAGPVAGGETVNLTDHPATDEHVGISTDGCWMVFDSDRAGETELYVSRLDPFEPLRVGSGVAGLWSSIAWMNPAGQAARPDSGSAAR